MPPTGSAKRVSSGPLASHPMTDEIRLDIVKGGTERNASTLELFFDLVYVFAITQVVGLSKNRLATAS